LGPDDLSNDVIALANRVYADDFALFGYEMRSVKRFDPDIFLERTWPSWSPGPGRCPGQLGGPAQQPSQALSFIHIPRTGGTSISECTVADSAGWGQYVQALNGKNGSHMNCFRKHVPPSASDSDYYVGKNTFCVVRNPYDRLISEYGSDTKKHKKDADVCSKDRMNQFLLNGLQQALVDPIAEQCHYLPQAAYVYDWKKDSGAVDRSKQHCLNVLHFEPNLDETFNALMTKHGHTYRLQQEHRADGTRSIDCPLTIDDLSVEVVELANKIYAADFELLGYEMRDP